MMQNRQPQMPSKTHESSGQLHGNFGPDDLRDPTHEELIQRETQAAYEVLGALAETGQPTASINSLGSTATGAAPHSQPEWQKPWDVEAVEIIKTRSTEVVNLRSNYPDGQANSPYMSR